MRSLTAVAFATWALVSGSALPTTSMAGTTTADATWDNVQLAADDELAPYGQKTVIDDEAEVPSGDEVQAPSGDLEEGEEFLDEIPPGEMEPPMDEEPVDEEPAPEDD